MKHIQTIDEFNKVIDCEKPVIVKFYADWCPDCKRMDTFVDDLLEDFSAYEWYEVNSDEIKGLAEKYDVMGIPSVLIFKNGEKIAHQHSAYTKTPDSISEFLNEHLG